MLVDLSNVKETSFGLLPEGDYLVSCSEAVVNETKDGTGEYIKCTFTVLNKDYFGRKIFHMFNIKNKNVKAVEIGLSQLKSFIKICGSKTEQLKDVSELVGLECAAKVKIKVDDQYGDKNVISYFKFVETMPSEVKKPDMGNIPF